MWANTNHQPQSFHSIFSPKLQLMMYLKEKSRVDMYMHSIQRLRALHLGLGNYVEAAAVLLLAINDSSPFSEDPSSSKNDDAQGKTYLASSPIAAFLD